MATTTSNSTSVNPLRVSRRIGDSFPSKCLRRSEIWNQHCILPVETQNVNTAVNGYVTEEPGKLAWIIGNAAPGKVLKINVRTAADGKEHTITVQLP